MRMTYNGRYNSIWNNSFRKSKIYASFSPGVDSSSWKNVAEFICEKIQARKRLHIWILLCESALNLILNNYFPDFKFLILKTSLNKLPNTNELLLKLIIENKFKQSNVIICNIIYKIEKNFSLFNNRKLFKVLFPSSSSSVYINFNENPKVVRSYLMRSHAFISITYLSYVSHFQTIWNPVQEFQITILLNFA